MNIWTVETNVGRNGRTNISRGTYVDRGEGGRGLMSAAVTKVDINQSKKRRNIAIGMSNISKFNSNRGRGTKVDKGTNFDGAKI